MSLPICHKLFTFMSLPSCSISIKVKDNQPRNRLLNEDSSHSLCMEHLKALFDLGVIETMAKIVWIIVIDQTYIRKAYFISNF